MCIRDSTSPLGLGFICGTTPLGGNHYAPNPPDRQKLTNATKTHIGYSRPAYASTYNGAVAEAYGSVAATPDELKLCFHNVPYGYKLGPAHGGLSVLEWIYASHKAGAATAAGYVGTWKSTKGRIETSAYGDDAFDQVLQRLVFGASEAQKFADYVVDYFANLTSVPPPAPGQQP